MVANLVIESNDTVRVGTIIFHLFSCMTVRFTNNFGVVYIMPHSRTNVSRISSNPFTLLTGLITVVLYFLSYLTVNLNIIQKH